MGKVEIKDEKRKNIIVIFVDALRPKNLSLFGYLKETDKNLKKIAEENLLFRNYFSTTNATAPALVSLFTGKYPKNHGIIHQVPYTKAKEVEKFEKVDFWLPSYLKSIGYETIGIDWFGLWFKKGYDYHGEERKEWGTKWKKTPFSSSKEMAELAISKIEKAKKPFFLFLHFWDTHFPFPNIEYELKGSEKDLDETLKNIKNENQREYMRRRVLGKGPYIVDDMIKKYDLAIEKIDNEVGRIYEFLKQKGLWEDCIFLFLGDHGDNLTEHGIYFSHSGLFEDSIHVPLIMRLPGFKNQKINALLQHVDVVPTILDYLKLKTESKFDGLSFLPILKDEKGKIRDKIFLSDGLCNDVVGVRSLTKKLIVAKDNFCNLCKGSHHNNIEEYDLEKDPGETNNIYSGESELMSSLNKHI